MKQASLFSILFVSALSVGLSSCTTDKPTNPDVVAKKKGPEGPVGVGGSSPKYFVSTVADLDTLLALPALPDIAEGDTIVILADLTLDGKAYTVTDKGFWLIGDKSGLAPLLTRDDTAPGYLFTFRNSSGAEGTDDYEVRNIKFDVNMGAPTAGNVIQCSQVRTATLVDLEFVVQDETVQLIADNVVVDNCDFEGNAGFLLQVQNRQAQAFNHLIKNSTFHHTQPSGGTVTCTASIYRNGAGTLELNSNVFSYETTGGPKRYHAFTPQYNGAGHTVNFRFIDNEFNDGLLRTTDNPGLTSLTLNILYDGNNNDVAVCVEDTYTCGPTCAVHPVWDIKTYTKQDSLFGYEGFNNFDLVEKCLVGDTVYVVFHTDSVGYNYLYDTAEAQYGDDACDNTTTAWRNGLNRWNAKFYVGYITDTDFYWRPRVTFCQKTIQKLCIKFPMRECDDEIPLWFQQQRR